MLDYVTPSPLGSTWGLGGTCVNVGCIPKKLMHKAGMHGEDLEAARRFGWCHHRTDSCVHTRCHAAVTARNTPEVKHDWGAMVDQVQDYISSLNTNQEVSSSIPLPGLTSLRTDAVELVRRTLNPRK